MIQQIGSVALDEKIRVPDIGDFVLIHNEKYEYCRDSFGIIVEHYFGPCYECSEPYRKTKLKEGLKEKLFGISARYYYEKLLEHQHFVLHGFTLDFFNAFGFQLPKCGGAYDKEITHKVSYCTETMKQKENLIYIGRENILKGLSAHGLSLFEPFITQILDNQGVIRQSLI